MSANDLSIKINNTDLFTEKSLIFESHDLDQDKISVPIANAKFGILNLKTINSSLSKENIEIIFMVDRSGSMSDMCSDGRSKMQHICHTLSNMVIYFNENQDINTHIIIHAFDDKIYNIIERCKITKDNLDEVLYKINHITPKNSTNIEMALKDISSTVEKIRSEKNTSEIVSIFMTDGEVSNGKSDPGYLSQIVDNSINNYFIGFGVDHDAFLLNSLGNITNSSYHFIDKIENSGYVYGEILHEILYKLLFNVKIEVKNGLIYDYKINLWVDSLFVANIVSESNKIYHIVSASPEICIISMNAEQNIYDKNGIEAIMLREISVFNENEVEDLTKYVFRQRTMQLLYNINNYNNRRQKKLGIFGRNRNISPINENNHLLKDQLNNFLSEMKKYMSENGMEDDKIMKNLCDDIYILLRTFGTAYGPMYSCARQTSQGTQRSYTVSHTPEDNNTKYVSKIPLTRQTHNIYVNPDDLIKDNVFSDTFNDISQHQVSGLEDSPFLSPSAARVMREISQKE